jgi:minor fimbrial subunit
MLKILSALFILMSCKAIAYDVEIRVSGRVVAQACTVDTTQLTLDLGKIYTSALATLDSYGDWVNSTIKLSKCPSVTSGITASFSGTKGQKYYMNSGTANNVEIQLQTASGFDLNNNTSQAINITQQGTAELPIRVRAYSPTGNVGEGTIVGTINVAYTYQ